MNRIARLLKNVKDDETFPMNGLELRVHYTNSDSVYVYTPVKQFSAYTLEYYWVWRKRRVPHIKEWSLASDMPVPKTELGSITGKSLKDTMFSEVRYVDRISISYPLVKTLD